MITRSQMRRQLRAQGGIMNAVPREKFGFGSSLKKFIRNIIPNELANVAVKAAPFVAAFNPGIAAAMRGIGRFDQRGSISDALKQAAVTYGGGKLAGKLGGASGSEMGNIFGNQTYSKQGFMDEGIGRFFKGAEKSLPTGNAPPGEVGGAGYVEKTVTEPTKGFMETATDKVFSKVPFQDKIPQLVKEKLLVGGITSAGTAIYNSLIEGYPDPEPGQDMTEYLAERKKRVGSQMRSLFDNYFKFDPEYSAMTDEQKDAFVARQNVMSGGRVGYQTGGITMANTLAENMRRNLANQQAVSQQFQAARSRLPGYVAPQRIAAPTPTPIEPDMPIGIPERPGLFPQPPKKIIQPEERVVKKPIDIVDFYEEVTQPPPVRIQPMPIDAPTKIIQPMPPMETDFSREINWQPGQPAPEGFKVEKMLGDEFLVPDDSQYIPPTEEESLIGGPVPPVRIQPMPIDAPTKIIDGPMTDEEILAERELNPPTQPFFPTYNDPLPYDQLMAGFAEWKRNNPDKVSNIGTMAIVPVTLPGGYEVTYSGGAEANNMRQYLESIGQAPMQRREYSEPIKSVGDGSGLSKLAVGGRVGFSDGSNLKIKLKEIGYEDTLLDTMSIKELRELLDSEKGTFTDSSVYRPGAAVGGIMNMPMGQPRVNKGGITELDYRAKGGFVPVGIKEKADDVPAMLSKNEFVFTADAVRGAGNGSVEKGAQKMYDTMKNLERRVT